VYYEEFETSKEATERENELLDLQKQLIKELVLENNPELMDI
jgi:predicted GIY-YIG superfamily endonuclease